MKHTIAWRPFFPSPNQTNGFTGGGAVCDGYNQQGTWIGVGRDAGNNRFRWSILERLRPATPWADLGTATFNSKPACAPLDEFHQLPASQHSYQKAIVGKRSSTNLNINDRYWQVPPPEGWDHEENRPLPTAPALVHDWQRISTSAYASAPAVTVAAGWLVVLGRRSGNRLYLQMNPLNTANPDDPFDNADWGSAFAVPRCRRAGLRRAIRQSRTPRISSVISPSLPGLATARSSGCSGYSTTGRASAAGSSTRR